MASKKDEDKINNFFNSMKDQLQGSLGKDLPGQIAEVNRLMKQLQPKFTRRVLIGKHKATATLGQSDNVMLDFDDPAEGKKYFDSLPFVSNASSSNEN